MLDSKGVNIGNYKSQEEAKIYFRAEVKDRNLVKGRNRLITWGKITSGSEALMDNADVYISK